jgi:hypothetical protein
MTIQQKKTNDRFFTKIMSVGSFYIYPDLMETFEIRDGKMIGSKRGVKEIKKITSKSFHNKLSVK